MKILQIISNGYVCGGAEKSVEVLKQHLISRGHEVKVLASDLGADEPSTFSDYTYAHIKPGSLSGYFKRLWNTDAHRAIKNAVSEFQPDVIHFHTMGELSPSAIFAAGNVPSILTVHGPEEYTKGLLEWFLERNAYKSDVVNISNLNMFGKIEYVFYRFIQRPLYVQAFRRKISCMVSPSKYLANVLEKENYGVPIRQIYNGLELPKRHGLPKQKRILFVGRLSYVKGVSHLLEAFEMVLESVPSAHLTIIGDGPEKKRLQKLAMMLKIKQQVDFLGLLSNKKVLENFGKSCLAVVPSIWPDNLPTVCIEAMAIGRPVVATKVGGVPELIKNKSNGFVVEPGDVHGMAEAIIKILLDDNLAEAMSDAASVHVKKFAIESFIKNIEKLYVEMAAR